MTQFMHAYLCCNISKGRLCRRAHAMNTSVSRTRRLRFLIYGTGRREGVFERLYDQLIFF